jgi:aminopeptidase N
MYKLLLFVGALFLSVNIYSQKPGAGIDVSRYSFKIKVNDANDSILASAGIWFKPVRAISSIELDLVSINKEGKGMKVTKVLSGNKELDFKHDQNKLNITLAGPASSDQMLEVFYTGIPADGLIISKTKYGRRSFFADNWPDRARNWLVCVDEPADKAAVDFYITAPAHYQVVANGMLMEESNVDASGKLTHYQETIPLPTKVMTVGIADFAVNYIDSLPNVRLSSWVYPEDRDKGFYDFALAKEIIPFFEQKLGPFPYRKLANVQSKTIFGGLENAGAIFYSENLVKGNRQGEPTIAHEIAHQWFGDMATEADFSHLWLSEGFATYMTMYYMEKKYGQDSANRLLAQDRQQVIAFAARKPRPVVDSAVSTYMDLLNANSYQKGSWVLHMLRKELGDDIFWKGIKLYYTTYAGKNAISGDLQKVMEQVSGKKLGQFFYQWLYVAGQPDLKINWKYNKAKKIVEITIEQQQRTVFIFPLSISFTNNSAIQSKNQKLNISQKKFTTEIPVDFEPTSVVVDKGMELLFSRAEN